MFEPGYHGHRPRRAQGLGRSPCAKVAHLHLRNIHTYQISPAPEGQERISGYGKPVEGRHESIANIAVAETERMPDLVSCRHQEAHLGGYLKVCPSYHSLIESTICVRLLHVPTHLGGEQSYQCGAL